MSELAEQAMSPGRRGRVIRMWGVCLAAVALIIIFSAASNMHGAPIVTHQGSPIIIPSGHWNYGTPTLSPSADESIRADVVATSERSKDFLGITIKVVLAIALALGVYYLYRNRHKWAAARERKRDLGDCDDGDGTDMEAATIRDRLLHSVQQLHSGAGTTDLIIELWYQLELSAAKSGVKRRVDTTSTEFVHALLAKHGLDPAAMERFAELYRQAMFSSTAHTDVDQAEAIACMERLAQGLAGDKR